jgi:hypothetical protein
VKRFKPFILRHLFRTVKGTNFVIILGPRVDPGSNLVVDFGPLEAGHETTSGAGGRYPSEECGRFVL